MLNTEDSELSYKIVEFNNSFHKHDFEPVTYIAKWRTNVDKIKSGYTLGIYDYTNDLSVRSILQSFSDTLNSPLKERFYETFLFIDEEFRQATYTTDLILIGNKLIKNDPEWWYHRLPLNLVGELQDDVEEMKLHASKLSQE